MFRGLFRLTVLACLLTFASLANSALSWHLPLPDLLPKTEPAPQCVLPGTTPKTTPPGAATTAYGDPATAAQPAGFGAVVPDLPSAMGKVQGQLLHKLDGPPPSQAQIQGVARAVGSGAARWFSSLRAAANGKDDPAQVTAYQDRQRATFLAQNTTSCNPCKPGMDGSGQPGMVGLKAGMNAEQRRNAGTIASVGAVRGIPTQGQVVAVAAALQESGLRNLSYGDRDSVGVLQQRAGWGSVAERMNVTVAAGKFYDALEGVPGWQSMTVAQAAQAVQRSKYPNAYARWENQARNLVSGTTVQPVAGGMTCASYQTTGKGPGPWGGYANGRIPTTALAHPQTAPRALFRPDAAAAFDQLSAAYRARFGVGISVTDSYRSLAGQLSCTARKGDMCAKPGTSNHGWGLAADLGGGIERFGTPQKAWMDANAPKFGWVNPDWARQGGSKPESWHHEYVGKGAAA